MARAPHSPNIRVTPQGAFEKLPGKAKRWRNVATGETISDRKMSGFMREARLRMSVSKERYTKGVKAGTFDLSERAAIRQAHVQVRREILSRFPGLGAADERAIFKWRRLNVRGSEPGRRGRLYDRCRKGPDQKPVRSIRKEHVAAPTASIRLGTILVRDA